MGIYMSVTGASNSLLLGYFQLSDFMTYSFNVRGVPGHNNRIHK